MSKKEEIVERRGMFISHAERLSQVPIDYPKTLCADYEVRGVEDVVENDRIVKKSCVKIVHPQDRFSGLKVSDFALENIIAVGALDSLRESKLNANTSSELSDGMDATIDNVIAAVDAAEASSSSSNLNDGGNE